MSKAIVRFLAILGALWLVTMVILICCGDRLERQGAGQNHSRSELRAGVAGGRPRYSHRKLMNSERTTLRDVVDAIDRGALTTASSAW